MRYFLGGDAGGTKSEFLLGDETTQLARVRVGTIKRMKADQQTTEANLATALDQLTASSGISMDLISCSCIGTAGESVPLVVDWLRQAFARRVAGDLVLVGDVEVALDACFFGERGVLVLAGTGSNVAGRAVNGRIVTAGGWGPAVSDQGSGHFLGLEALRRIFLSIDQRRATSLLGVIQAHLQIASLGELIEYANANPAPDFSKLSPLVVSCAEQGDAVAQEILEEAGRDLASLAALVIDHLRNLEEESSSPPSHRSATAAFALPRVAVAGSILERVLPVRQELQRSLRRRYPGILFVETPSDPAAGALWKARNWSAGGQRG